jgi:gluconokinase
MVRYCGFKVSRRTAGIVIVIIMGVAGAGKTTIGALLAKRLGWLFVDADSFHSPANIEKIKKGTALDEADREPWLDAIREAELQWSEEKRNVILACSALRRSYRKKLDVGPEATFVYLKGSKELISQRLNSRKGHFAGRALLSSQFSTLEEPQDAITIEVEKSPEEIVREVLARLNLT